MKRSLILAVSFLALGAGGCANRGANTAGEGTAAARTSAATPPAASFIQADLDGDARIDRQEFDSWRRQSADSAASAPAAAGGTRIQDAFDAADSNGNGVLTLDEWQVMVNRPGAAAGASRGTSAQSR